MKRGKDKDFTTEDTEEEEGIEKRKGVGNRESGAEGSRDVTRDS